MEHDGLFDFLNSLNGLLPMKHYLYRARPWSRKIIYRRRYG
ncbi:hypothetical protein SAMN04488069_11213 [Hymenobacter psychrophilus]|uniref:Uncharacterized protein n=1 Tax=Hymenobacter psychrophilus TaxID=651662 RepID=A0A1H3M2V5_9BACT|nr:hypothetical protein SAMN04488069_11213 [Hymenobacter psychrophilus]